MRILGTKIDYICKKKVFELFIASSLLSTREKHKAFFFITANGEFILQAQSHLQFTHALQKADLILPDGVSLLQARDYLRHLPGVNSATWKGYPRWMLIPQSLFLALKIFFKTLSGGYADQRITGIEILQYFLKAPYGRLRHAQAENSSLGELRIFLLGGRNGVTQKLAEKYNVDYYQGPNDITKITQQENEEILQKIAVAKPDMLFVSFGHFNQEIWIAQNLEKLSARTVIGVGSAFDEIAGIGQWSRPVPNILQAIGFKWLWRLYKNPRHIGRVWRALVVFPWKVFISTL